MTDTTLPLTERLHDHVAGTATRLQRQYAANLSSAVASLAMLRRGVSLGPGEDIRLLPLTIAGLYASPDRLPDEPTDAEHAAYAALTLFGVHQQSHRTNSMHRVGYPFGRSARLLGRRTNRDAVRRRFTAIATASTWDATLHHARGLVQQLRSAGIPLDYGQFAVDLFQLRSPYTAERVRQRWGLDFYRERLAEDDDTDSTSDDQQTSPSGTDNDTES